MPGKFSKGPAQMVRLGDLFNDDELLAARKIIRAPRGDAVERLEKEVVLPAMPRINETTKQENHPRYFAYLLLHYLG